MKKSRTNTNQPVRRILTNKFHQHPYYPKKDDFFFFVPLNLDLDALLSKAISKNLSQYKIVKFLSLIGQLTIVKQRNYSRHDYEFFSKSHATMGGKKLKKEIGNDYPDYYKFLKDEGVINRTPYKVGKAMGYGYQPHFRYNRLSVKIFSANKLVQKIQPKFSDKATEKYCKNLVKPFRRENFGINYILAENLLFEKYGELFIQNEFGGYMLDDENNSMLKYGAYQNGLIQLIKFLNGQFYFKRSNFSFTSSRKNNLRRRKEKNRELRNITKLKKIKRKAQVMKPKGRLYTTFSFLPKLVRDLLYFDGEKLEQIDVKNCVIYMLSNYLQSTFSFSEQMLKDMITKSYLAKYNYNITKNCLAEHGIELVLENFTDIQLPLDRFCVNKGNNLTGAIPLADANSLLFQLGCDPGNKARLLDELPKANVLKAVGKKGLSVLPGRNPTEKYEGSIPLKPNSTLNLGDKIAFEGLSSRSSNNLSKGLQKVIFTKMPVEVSAKPLSISGQTARPIKNPPKCKERQPSLGSFLLSHYMQTEMLQTSLSRELTRFQILALSGKFYESFIPSFKKKLAEKWKEKYEARIKMPYKGTALEDRKFTKEMLISLIYARNENTDYKEIKWAFVERFPVIYLLITELKGDCHKQFAQSLFNLEAEVMINKIAEKLLKNKISCLTVHDCIAVKKTEAQQTVEIMMDAFKEMFGVTPQIEFESSN